MWPCKIGLPSLGNDCQSKRQIAVRKINARSVRIPNWRRIFKLNLRTISPLGQTRPLFTSPLQGVDINPATRCHQWWRCVWLSIQLPPIYKSQTSFSSCPRKKGGSAIREIVLPPLFLWLVTVTRRVGNRHRPDHFFALGVSRNGFSFS